MQYSYKLREAAGERIPNQYIVVLKNSVVSPTSVVPKAVEARNQGAELHHIYQNAIRGYSVRVPNSDVLDSILSNPAVDYAQPDLIFRTTAQDLPTGVNRVDGDLSSTKSGDGTGSVDVDIAILDTGIDLDHPDLNVYREKTFVLGTTTANDDDNHGTRVSGLAAAIDDGKGVVGMAPGARLWAVKVLDSTGTGTDSDIIKGIDYVTANAAEIDTVNLSFGGEGPDSALHTAIANSVAAGLTYVASAGNDNRDAASQVPASFPEVITVSAIVDTDGKCGQLGFSTTVGDDDTLADFSNFGSIVDMAAPGVILKTTDLGGSYTTGNHFSGTSASAPVVTGAAALYKWTHPSASPSQIRDALRNSGSTPSTGCDGKGHGYFTGDGDGSPEPLLYMASASPPVDSTLPTLTGRTPASSATGVAVGSSIAATFSEAVQSGTVTGTTFTLKNSAGTSIAATVTYDSTTKTATLKPSAALASSTTYTATLTNGIKDIAGNALVTTSWSFTTAAQADTTAPTLTGRTPASSATGVAVGSSIAATFSEAVQSGTVTGTTFTLKNSAGTSIAATVTYDSTTKTATLKPSAALAYSTSYTTTLTNGIKDIAGNALATTSWSFTTVAAPSSSACNSNLPITGTTSSPTQTGFTANNVIDNSPTTKWWSTFSVNPWIKLDLGSSKSICSVDIAWADGNQRQYTFKIEISTDGNSYSNVFSGKSSGTTTSPQKYSFAETSGRYVKITITQSHFGSSNSIAQISELDVFGKTGTTGINANSRTQRNYDSSSITTSAEVNANNTKVRSSLIEEDKGGTGDRSEGGAEIISTRKTSKHDLAPVAKDDLVVTKINTAVVAKVLQNDKDRDGDDLKVISVSDSKFGASVTVNRNGTITFLPAADFAGQDTFTYTMADGEGKSDKGKVTINVIPDRKQLEIDNQAMVEEDHNDRGERTMRNQGGAENNEVEVIEPPKSTATEGNDD